MRIKSYFAPSVQSAISSARKEFGDDVTLVTSHTAALEARHLGDYEVVFAVEEARTPAEPVEPALPTQVIKATTVSVEPAPVPEPPPLFEQVLQEAITVPLSTEENLAGKLERVRAMLLEMGTDPAMLRALMTIIERSLSLPVPAVPEPEALPVPDIAATAEAAASVPEPEPEPAPKVAAPLMPDLTPAELAFYLSVSVGS